MNKKLAVLATLALCLSAGASWASTTTTISGTVKGYLCETLAKACAIDPTDPVAAEERVFVVSQPDGSYVLVPNVDRIVLRRHLSEKVRVTGLMDQKHRAVRADSIDAYVPASNGWKTVWTQAQQDRENDRMYDP